MVGGIRFIVPNKSGATMKDVTIRDCDVRNVAHTGIKLNGVIVNLKIHDNTIYKVGGPGYAV